MTRIDFTLNTQQLVDMAYSPVMLIPGSNLNLINIIYMSYFIYAGGFMSCPPGTSVNIISADKDNPLASFPIDKVLPRGNGAIQCPPIVSVSYSTTVINSPLYISSTFPLSLTSGNPFLMVTIWYDTIQITNQIEKSSEIDNEIKPVSIAPDRGMNGYK